MSSSRVAGKAAATAKAQNYPPFLHEAKQALVKEFRNLEQQDWQEWRQQQEWRLRQADDEDDATCRRLQDHSPYSDCRAKLLAIRQECARGADFFESECD
jgi:arylamine N-acetyltransferase